MGYTLLAPQHFQEFFMSIQGQVFEQVADVAAPTFPEFRIFGGDSDASTSGAGKFVVLFTNETTGVVVSSLNRFNPVGLHSSTWEPKSFSRFDGFLLLHNTTTDVPPDEAIAEMLSMTGEARAQDELAASMPEFKFDAPVEITPELGSFMQALRAAAIHAFPGAVVSIKA
jgi:hypothetical protein